MSAGPEIPRCSHGNIILGCPHDDCVDQNNYLATQASIMDRYHASQQADARRLVRSLLGLPTEQAPFPPHDPDYPDVDPATGDERETTTGPATDGPWDGPDDDGPEAA